MITPVLYVGFFADYDGRHCAFRTALVGPDHGQESDEHVFFDDNVTDNLGRRIDKRGRMDPGIIACRIGSNIPKLIHRLTP